MRTRSVVGFALAAAALHGATRLKEVVAIEGVRDNQLVGYGVVVGLNGTGDKRQTVFSAQSLANMLQRMGVTVTPGAILVRNTASVIVTANLPPFAQPGTKVDVTAAAIGDATNLQGGLLVLTPLKGPDGKVYAMAGIGHNRRVRGWPRREYDDLESPDGRQDTRGRDRGTVAAISDSRSGTQNPGPPRRFHDSLARG
jgi:flagellar basal body P-ring protein FlgI